MIDYKKEIAIYGSKLKSEQEKQIARYQFQRLYDMGFDFDFIYYAIQHLNGKNIADNWGLLFYPPFQKEVELIMNNEKRKENELKEKQKQLTETAIKCMSATPKIIKVEIPEKAVDKGLIDLDSIE